MADPLEPTPPDTSEGLVMAYWLRKWLPDPPPDALDELVLVHLHTLASTLADDGLRELVQQPIAQLVHERLGAK